MSRQALKLRFPAPDGVPANVATLAFGEGDTVELRVRISGKRGVTAYGFAFDGAPVVLSSGQGKFFAPRGELKLLEWTMVGKPGGAMKVSVTRDGQVVQEREASRISPPYARGYDAFEIAVS